MSMLTGKPPKAVEWIEQYVRLGHLIIGLLVVAGGGLVTATMAWASVTRDIAELKNYRQEQEPRSRRMDRNIVKIAAKLGIDVEHE